MSGWLMTAWKSQAEGLHCCALRYNQPWWCDWMLEPWLDF